MELRADDINAEQLPLLLRELSKLIGLPDSLKLASAFPGVPVYVPARPHPDHPIAQIIGFDSLQKLSDIYGQEYLRMPNITVRKLKHQLVQELRARNVSTRQIALQTGFCQRRIEQLNQGRKTQDNQADLFADENYGDGQP